MRYEEKKEIVLIKGMVGRYSSVEGILRYADILSRLAKTNRYLRINNNNNNNNNRGDWGYFKDI